MAPADPTTPKADEDAKPKEDEKRRSWKRDDSGKWKPDEAMPEPDDQLQKRKRQEDIADVTEMGSGDESEVGPADNTHG